MKKNSLFLFLLCLTIFSFLRFYGFSKKNEIRLVQQLKPPLPSPLSIRDPLDLPSCMPLEPEEEGHNFSEVLSHPWIKKQASLTKVSLEMLRDINALECFFTESAKRDPNFSREKALSFLIRTLENLQKQVPFEIPDHLYNVLCIPHSLDSDYQVYKRVYLGEGDSGLPLYIDIKVYSLDSSFQVQKILQQHLDSFEDGFYFRSFLKGGYLVQGTPKPAKGHGFAKLQGERGMLLYPVVRGNTLFLAYFETVWTSFERYLKELEQIKIQY